MAGGRSRSRATPRGSANSVPSSFGYHRCRGGGWRPRLCCAPPAPAMPLSLRFVVPLALALAAIAYAVVPLVDRLPFQWFVRALDARGALIAQTAQEPLSELMRDPRGAKARVQRYFERIMQGERIYAIGLCDRAGHLAFASPTFPQAVQCPPPDQREARSWGLQLRDGPLHVSANPVAGDAGPLGSLVIVHDMSFANRTTADTRQHA